MFKLIMIFFSVCSSLFELVYSFNNTVSVNDEIIDYNDSFYLKEDHENYTVFNEEVKLTFQKFPIYKVINDKLYVSIHDETGVYLYCYSLNGEIISENFVSIEMKNVINLFAIGNKIYCVGNVDGSYKIEDRKYENTSVVIIDFFENKFFMFGSENYEEVVTCCKGENLYLLVYKDKITNGDFGNGGNYDKNVSLVIINDSLEIVRVCVYDIDLLSENKFNLYYREQYVFLKSNLYIYKFNDDLKYLSKVQCLNENIVGEKLIALFDNKKIYIYDIYFLNEVGVIENTISTKKLYVLNNQIIMKDDGYYNVDVVDYRSFRCFDVYYQEIDDKNTVYTLFGKAELIENECDRFFNKNIVGNYEFQLTYKNINNLIFEKSINQEIRLETNVCEGMVYPTGYRIMFNGNGKLNGETVVSNYPIYTEGDYELCVDGSDYEKKIKFKIRNGIYENSDKLYDSIDFFINSGEEIKIELFTDKEEFEIINIESNYKTNNISIEDTANKKNIVINYGILDEGIHYIFIGKIYIKIGNEEKEIIINRCFNVLVYKEARGFELNNFDCENLKVLISSFDNSCRALEVIVNTDNVSERYLYLINPNINNVDLIDLKRGITNVDINLIFYTGYSYGCVNVCNIIIDDYENMESLGIVYKNSNDINDENNRITIDLGKGKDVIKKININDKLVYSKAEGLNLKFIILGVIIGGILFVLLVFWRKKKKIKLDK